MKFLDSQICLMPASYCFLKYSFRAFLDALVEQLALGEEALGAAPLGEEALGQAGEQH